MVLNATNSNRWVLTKSKKILKIVNFTKSENEIVLYASELLHIDDLYVKPIRSSNLYIYNSDLKEMNPKIYKLCDILCKLFYVSCATSHTYFPLLHTLPIYN